MRQIVLIIFSITTLAFACSSKQVSEKQAEAVIMPADTTGLKKAYFAAGCFWCVEGIFEAVKGVKEVVSGYAGGSASSASYKKVSAGVTEHAEAVEIYYDPKVISYETLLVAFFDSHDPTTLNRQGPDYGRQYRSMILYKTEEEKKLAEAMISKINQSGQYKEKVVTEVVPFDAFYPAEEYHQDYKKRNPDNSYIQKVSMPRFIKFSDLHPELLKEKK